jgi:hypothetical protein
MADPTETYAHDDTPHPKTCYEMSRLANVLANDLMEDILRDLTLQAICCPYGGPDTVARTHADRIPRNPDPIAYAALNSDRRATGYYAPRSVKDADRLTDISVLS